LKKRIENFFRGWLPKEPNLSGKTKLKRHTTPIAVLLLVTLVLSVSFSILSSTNLFQSPLTPGVLLNAPSANGQTGTLTVPDDFPTIQAAIGNASAGATVFVRKGVYYLIDSLTGKEGIIIDKPISLVGEDKQETILTPTPTAFMPISVIHIKADNVTISGFTINGQACDTGNSFGGKPFPSSLAYSDYLKNNTIAEMGIRIEDSSTHFPSGCKIIGNNIINNRVVGVEAGGNNDVISGNLILNNLQFGIGFYGSDSVISDNNITGTGYAGIDVTTIRPSKNVTINGNNIIGNGVGNITNNKDFLGGLSLRNINPGPYYVYGNNISDNTGFGVQFTEGSNNCAVYNNNIIHNDFGIELPNFEIVNVPSRQMVNIGIGNLVYNNNIMDNSQNAFRESTFQFNRTIASNGTDVVSWDNGDVGNYWSDYNSKYPNAMEVDTSGTGNIQYTISKDNIDYYPLIQKVDTSVSAPSLTASPTVKPPVSGIPLMTTAIFTVVMISAILIASILYYRAQKEKRCLIF
jgi:hypothetical protein